MADLAGRTAVVTGGGSGLGAAMARMFADAGMNVAVLDIDAEAAPRTVATIALGLGRDHDLRARRHR